MQIIEWPARRCSGESCKQGRSECKTPDACQLPEADSLNAAGWFWLGYAAFIVAALLAVWLLAGGL